MKRKMIRTDIYLHSSKESNFDHAQKIGLTGEAETVFLYALSEVKITIDVNEVTGEAVIIAVDDRLIQ